VLRSGKSFTISRRSRPVVRIVPCEEVIGPRWDPKFTFPDSSPFWNAMKRIESRRKAPARGSRRFRKTMYLFDTAS
jgi:antitoxin (DNA-binding transcriptional repressor) of toxin-antitoxin stability system